jgi:hypothetical protein
MSSLIATINRDRAWAGEGNKSICDGRTTACDLVGVNGSGQPMMLSRMYPASRLDIPPAKAGYPVRRSLPASIDATRKGLSTTFTGANVIPLT